LGSTCADTVVWGIHFWADSVYGEETYQGGYLFLATGTESY